ncbi:MAG TPA: hypothetical protein VMD74_05595 [Candidatus Methylomirabilis sp.]|nr:hypothetical protein [Candidatus Methylomirabilis sp.]
MPDDSRTLPAAETKKIKSVKMGLSPETMSAIEKIQSYLKLANRADAVAAAVKITKDIVEWIEAGGKVVRKKSGHPDEVINFII